MGNEKGESRFVGSKVYAFFDLKADHYGEQLFLFPDETTARRFCRQVVNEKDKNRLGNLSLIADYPDEFAFRQVGEWHQLNGELVPYSGEVGSYKDLGLCKDYIVKSETVVE